MERIYRTIKSVLDPFRYNSLEDKNPPVNFSSIDKEMIYHIIKSVRDSFKYKINIERIYYKIKSIMDSFRYKSLEDKDAPTNFSLIDFINNNTGTYLVSFPGAGWIFDNFIETCVICGTWIPF